MGPANQTSVSEFILLGLSDKPEHQRLLFLLFLPMYLVTVLGNLLIILAIVTDPHLHTPMYFFLANLSLVDVCFSSTTVPKMLASLHTQQRAIPFAGCLAQMYAFHLFGPVDTFLLAVMAIDRFVAIVHPLRYSAIMSPRACGTMVGVSWALPNVQTVVHTALMARLSFCGDTAIPHFFCDLMPLLKLACSDTRLNELVVLGFSVVLGLSPLLITVFSYACIFRAVARIPSAQGKWKAFSTCGSHLTVVSLFYGTIFAVYLLPASASSAQKDKAAALMYAIIIPLLNPFIYSLRNRDMKGALRKLTGKTAPSASA